jgi:heptaprenyl diphosphate synthase
MKHDILVRIARVGVYTAVSLLLFMVEGLLPPLIPLAPGVKLGFANIVTLFAVLTLGRRDALAVLAVRCVLGTVFSGNWFGILYSLGGGLAAYAVMVLLVTFLRARVSIPAVSVAGAVTHNLVQTFIASLVVKQARFFVFLPWMTAVSIVAGITIGFAVWLLYRYVPPRLYAREAKEVPEDVFG